MIYYYSVEIDLYYLQSRYYDAKTGRFVNTDYVLLPYLFKAFETSFNVFSYCDNSPINGSDSNGYLYISYTQIKNFIDGIKDAMKWCNGWKQVGAVLAFYLPILLSWIHSLPVIGQVLFAIIVVCVLIVALEFAYAFYIKKRGVEISINWGGLKIIYR